jgi:hypothetical protein
MDRRDSWKACEVVWIQREHVGDPVNLHRCYQTSVMHLNPCQRMRDYEMPPLLVDSRRIRNQHTEALDEPGPAIRVL